MTRIVASRAQRSCRDLFKAAVEQAQQVMRDPERKATWLKKVRQRHRLFNQLIKHYMLAGKKAAKKREMEGKYLVRTCFKQVNAIRERPVPLPALPATAGTPVLDMAYRV
jgi:hypothetical protein